MTDALTRLLEEAADDLAAAAVVPPVPPVTASSVTGSSGAVPIGQAGRRAARRSRLAILAAAASAVAVAAAAALVAGDVRREPEGPVPITRTVATVAQAGPDAVSRDDAPAPVAPDGRRRPGYNASCAQGEVVGRLTLAADGGGVLTLEGGAPQEQPCGLPGAAPVLWAVPSGGAATALTTEYPQQPDVPSPPQRPDEVVVSYRALTAPLRWQSYCGGPVARLELRGLAAAPIPVAFGRLPACRDGGDPTVRLERLSRGEAAAIVPTDRQRLTVEASFPQRIPAGAVRPYTVTLANPSREPVSLRPCPTYLLHVREELPAGSAAVGGHLSGRTAPLPCDRLPATLRSGEQVVVELEERFGTPDPGLQGEQPLQVHWAIAGTTAYETVVQAVHAAPPAPFVVVPWQPTSRPPGEPATPAVGEALPYSSLRPTIENLPSSARPGEVIRYDVRLTNTAGAGSVPLDPCPGFVQHLQGGRGAARVEAEDERYLNCAQAPPDIPAGAAVLLRMELRIPQETPAGDALLTWKVGKLDNGGSPSGFGRLEIVRR